MKAGRHIGATHRRAVATIGVTLRPPYDGAHRVTLVTFPAEDSTQGAPYALVSYGPLLFALPIPDTKDENTPDPSARWNHALDVQKPGISVEHHSMPDKWNWPLQASLQLRVNAAACKGTPTPNNPLPSKPVAKPHSSETITLVPHGCTKFRVSMFPVTTNTEGAREK